MAGEFERIAMLSSLFGAGEGSDVTLGIGDDAALLDARGPLALTVDVAVEGVHFRRDFAPLDILARRATAAAASDLWAMGAEPLVLLSSLILPPELTDGELEAIGRGQADLAKEIGAPVVGGNLAKGDTLSITTTAVGRADRAIRRDGARPGDSLYVGAPVGGAAAGLAALLSEDHTLRAHPEVQEALVAWRRFPVRLSQGLALREHASAAIDLSDGLVQDAGHIAAASKVVLGIEARLVPVAAAASTAASVTGEDPLRQALTGGEDYELLFTLPEAVAPPFPAHRIGRVVALDPHSPQPPAAVVLDADGSPIDLGGAGFQHF